MKTLPASRRSHWYFAILVIALLGAQVAQAAHVHTVHGIGSDCVQCQVNGGKAMAVADATSPPCLPADSDVHPDIATTLVATFYRLFSARGPPTLSR